MTWTLTGRFARTDGNAAVGYVRISSTPAVLVDTDGDTVFVSPADLALDDEGRIPANALPWSDDPHMIDPPVYEIQVRLNHRTLTPVTGVQVPQGVAAMDYTDLAHAALGPTVNERLDALTADLSTHTADSDAHDIPEQLGDAVAIIDGGTL